ncbi:MAG: prepilin peptidase [Synergistaceae bacterium]|nr:prepilin peptidase [Synergistaceae bacterium]MBQ3450480.1 prepilin peptidase [Synergistaceae bacterium]MBQ9629541.1 prepilin peptidase [Synergistaceae bacterium]
MTPAYLVLVLITSILGAFTDIRSGRVKNIHLTIALLVWLILAVSEYLILHSSSVPGFTLAFNVLFALITSIIFYLTDIWAPGDCKLYIVISIIFPVHAYVIRKGNIFPALNFVIYAFALGYIFLLAMTFTRRAAAKMNLNPKFALKHYLSVLANAGIISCINIILNTCIPKFFYANQILCILSSAVLICLVQKKANRIRMITGFMCLIYILIQSILMATLLNTSLSLIMSLVIASVIEIITNRASVNTYREIPGDEVRPGMILSFMSLWAMRKCIDPELPTATTENCRSRITKRQAEAVKKWCRNAHSNIVIVEMMPFAPFIAGAVMIEILRFLILECWR